MLEDIRQKIDEVCLALPGAEVLSHVGQHAQYSVRGRTFTYYLVDHHGDGRVAINCKVAPGFQSSLIESDPERFFMPAYLGHRGWIGLSLDQGVNDWDEVAWLVANSYQLVAPKRLAALVVSAP